MKDNNFVWTDLSSYDPEKSAKFYKELFGWDFYEEYGYKVAYVGENETAGFYETPDFFKEINMPHFWMGYIQVDNVDEVVAIAREKGAKIEIEKDEFYGGNIALIRDPLGAGFTIYDGDSLNSKSQNSNSHIFSELHVSDVSKVKDFYMSIFSWAIESHGDDTYGIYNYSGEHIGDIQEIPNFYKGKYEYWVQTFSVEDLEEKVQKVKSLGGEIVSEEEGRALVTDNSGESFFYIKQIN